MKIKKHPISAAPKKVLYRLRNCYFSLASKTDLPKGDFYCGLVGCGNFVKYAYVPALNERGNPIIVSGFHSRSERSAKEVSRRLRYKTDVFHSYKDLLESGIKAVMITTPNDLHYDYIVRALEKGLDIFCEKPVANRLEDAFSLKALVDKTSQVLMIGFNERYLDRIRKIKAFLDLGHLGKIKQVEAFHNQNIEGFLKKSDWLTDAKRSGGGVLCNSGVHLINVMLYLFGGVQKVSAKIETRKLPVHFGEDTASCELFFESGFSGRIKMSYINGVDSTYEHMVIKGERGTLVTDMLNSDINFYESSSGRPTPIACKKEIVIDSIFNELAHFHDCIKGRHKPETDIDDSIKTLSVVKAAYISAEEKRLVYTAEVGRSRV